MKPHAKPVEIVVTTANDYNDFGELAAKMDVQGRLMMLCPECKEEHLSEDVSVVAKKETTEEEKPEWLSDHECRFNDGEQSCKCFIEGYERGVKDYIKALDLLDKHD